MVFKLFFLFISTTVFAQNTLRTTDFEQSLNAKAPRNYVANSGIEKNDFAITDASSIASRTTSQALEGVASLLINSTASAEKVIFQTLGMQVGLANRACESTFVYTGDATLYKAYVEIGAVLVSTEVTLTNAGSDARSVSIVFPCGPSGSGPYLVIESLGNGAAIRVDSVYVGEATSIGTVAQAEYVGSVAVGGPNNFVNNSVSGGGNFGYVSAASPSYIFTNGSATLSAPASNRAGFTASLPAGRYMINYTGPLRSSGTTGSFCQLRFSDGTINTNAAVITTSDSGAVQSPGLSVLLTYTTSGTREIALQVAQTGIGECSAPAPASIQSGRIDIYRYPLQSEIVVRGDVTNVAVEASGQPTGSLTAANPTIWGTEARDTTGSYNPATGEFTAPLAGDYCFGAQVQVGGTESADQVVELTPYRNGSVLSRGRGVTRIYGATSGVYAQSNYCTYLDRGDILTYRTNTNITTPAFGGGSNENWLYVQNASGGVPKPFIPGSVFSSSSGIEKVNSARVLCDSSSSIFGQSGSWITSVTNISSGSCTYTLPSGVFSTAPFCTATNALDPGANTLTHSVYDVTTTSLKTRCRTGAGDCGGNVVTIICKGAN